MSFKGQSYYYGMSHFGMLNILSSLWMSFKGQDQLCDEPACHVHVLVVVN
jgi:hypothetical protein